MKVWPCAVRFKKIPEQQRNPTGTMPIAREILYFLKSSATASWCRVPVLLVAGECLHLVPECVFGWGDTDDSLELCGKILVVGVAGHICCLGERVVAGCY